MMRFYIKGVLFWVVFYFSFDPAFGQYNMPLEVIHFSTDPSQATNMVILGDGYTIEDQGKFISDAQRATADMLNQLPWSNYKENINVLAIKVVSEVSGAAMDPNNLIDNYFGSSFWSFNIERLLVAWRSHKVWSVLATNAPFFDIGVIMVNDSKYGGSGGTFAVFSTHSQATEIMIHELGHSFVNLADEYWAGQQYAGEKPNMTQNSNPETIKWRSFLNKNGVGIYPYEESPTWHRPHQNCKMRFLGRAFCDVCSHELEGKLQFLATEPDPSSPIAFFGADKLRIFNNEAISFFDLSSYAPDSWEWTFEGGTPSTSSVQNPKVIYKNQGTYTVSLKVKNGKGENVFTRTGFIHVEELEIDEIPPTVRVKNIDLYLDENGNAVIVPEDVDDGTTDDVELDRISLSKMEFDCQNLGENFVVFSAFDKSGNKATAEVLVNVIDRDKPIVKAKNCVVILDENGIGLLRPEDVDDGSFDNCGISQFKLSKSTFDCGDLGENTVIFKAVDDSGNEATAEVVITVVDKTEPIIKAKNIEIQLDENGFAKLTPENVDDGSFDNCGISKMILSKTEFGRDDAGENKVKFTVYDLNSNEASVEITVMVNIILAAENGEIPEPLKLYPNPANDIIFIEYLKSIDPQLKSIEIIDIKGRVLNEIRAFERNGNVIPIEIKGLKSGQYFIRLNTQKSVKTLRFAIVR